jgi:thioredoxin:protein disulfide reductase
MIAANSPYSRPWNDFFCCYAATQSLGHGLRLRYSAGMKIWPLALLMLCLTAVASAKPWWMRGVESNETDFLPPDVAFRVRAGVDGHLVRVRWVIADGYYLYRRKIEIKAESPDLNVAAPQLPQGTMKVDPYLGTQEIYKQQVEATAVYSRFDYGAHPMQIKVTYQGCAEAGLCYPPITKVLFPEQTASAPAPAAQPWEGVAILGGGFAFLLAGLLLRKGRKLDLPAT